jgi:uncharacterized protein YoxC
MNYLLIAIINFVCTALVIYLSKYLGKKAENLATKEDVGQITKQVESIRHLYLKELESLRAVMNAQLYIHQTRYQNEFNILKDLSEKIFELRDSGLSLRPVLDHINQNEPEEKRKANRLNRYSAAAVAFYKMYESYKPFYPAEIYSSITELNKLIRKEAVEYAITSDKGIDFDPKYWEKAMANGELISKLANEAIELIRNRVKYWEEFKIGKD